MLKALGVLAWAWTILIGALLITPIGPICIACGHMLIPNQDIVLGAISIVLGLAGLATVVNRG